MTDITERLRARAFRLATQDMNGDGARLAIEAADEIDRLRKRVGEPPVESGSHQCEHTGKRTSGWDHTRCDECGSIWTGSWWGIASFKWFRSTVEAKFYQETGRRPE